MIEVGLSGAFIFRWRRAAERCAGCARMKTPFMRVRKQGRPT